MHGDDLIARHAALKPQLLSWQDEFQRLCASLLSADLVGWGCSPAAVYILLASDIVRDVPKLDGTPFAVALDTAGLFRGFIADYRGPGPCWLIDDYKLTDYDDAGGQFLGACLHEAAHSFQLLYRESFERFSDDLLATHVPDYAADILSSESEVRDSLPWEDHGLQFIRAALHLWGRADDAGDVPPFGDVVDTTFYKLSFALNYARDAGFWKEFEDLRHMPIGEILKTPAPESLAALFEADVTYYWESQLQHQRTSDDANPRNGGGKIPPEERAAGQRLSIARLPACTRQGG